MYSNDLLLPILQRFQSNEDLDGIDKQMICSCIEFRIQLNTDLEEFENSVGYAKDQAENRIKLLVGLAHTSLDW